MKRFFTIGVLIIVFAHKDFAQNPEALHYPPQGTFRNESYFPRESAIQAFASPLPIIRINTRGHAIPDEPKIEVDLGIIYKGNNQLNYSYEPSNHFNGEVYIELHGASSNYYSQKKSYGFKIVDANGADLDTSILGLPREHSFVLHASYFDKTFLRNTLTYKIYGLMGHYSPRTQYVELMVNDQYQGLYVLVEKIKRDKSRIDIAKLTTADVSENDITGGYIFKIDRVNGNGGQGWYSKYKKDPSDSLPAYFQYDYPEFDSLMPVQRDYIQNYVNTFEDAMNGPYYTDPEKGYRKYISIASFTDKFIINELSKNVDGYRLSEYLYKEKLTSRKRGLVYCGPAWDYDIAWGNANFGNATDPYRWQYLEKEGMFYSPTWWRRLMADIYFKDELYCRYAEFRKIFLNTAFLYRYIDSVALTLKEPLERNYAQWPTIGMATVYSPQPVPPDYAGEIKVLKDWIAKRIGWMDGKIQGKCNPSSDISEPEEHSDLTIYPNPFGKSLNITLSNPSKFTEIVIYNSIGAMVYSEKVRSPGTSFVKEINLKGLAAGVYMAKVIGHKSLSRKIIKID